MRVPLRFARYQGPVLRGMGEAALASMRREAPRDRIVPGPWIEERVPARPASLVDAYCEHVGARPGRYERTIPPHFFPQWAFALTGRLLRDLRSYPLVRVMNGGCRLDVHGELPRDRELVLRGRLQSVDDDGKRAIVEVRYETGVEGDPQILVA